MKLAIFLRELGQPVAYYPKLAQVTGGVVANLFLCQMYYWQGKQDDPNGWIYKTQPEIEAETGLGRTEQELARQLLRRRGLLQERYKGLPRRLEFWLDEEELENRWAFFLEYKGEKPLVEDAKPTQKRISNPNAKPPKRQKATSHYKPPEALPEQAQSILPNLDNIDCAYRTILLAQIGQASLPKQDNIACPNRTSKSAQTGQAILSKQDKQVCPNRASNLYTENTPQITSENTPQTTLPPIPPKRGMSVWVKKI